MNGLDREQFEQIVRRCVEQLLALGHQVTSPGEARRPSPAPAAPARREWQIEERVVTLQTLQGRLEGIEHVIVRRDAVVTPAVQDELRQRRIPLSRADRNKKTEPESTRKLVLATSGGNVRLEPLVQHLARHGISVTKLEAAPLAGTVERLTRAVADGCAGLLLTSEWAPALCLANRGQHVRATLALDGSSARQAVESVGANLLVVPVEHCEAAWLPELLTWFAAGMRPCPAPYQHLLEKTPPGRRNGTI